jgi:S-adenosylmethionine synthetase
MLTAFAPAPKSVTARHGHFGRPFAEHDVNGKKQKFFTWERTDKAEALKKAAGL